METVAEFCAADEDFKDLIEIVEEGANTDPAAALSVADAMEAGADILAAISAAVADLDEAALQVLAGVLGSSAEEAVTSPSATALSIKALRLAAAHGRQLIQAAYGPRKGEVPN